jgi:hypothetical protein
MAQNQAEVLRRMAGLQSAHAASQQPTPSTMMSIADTNEPRRGNHAALKQELAQSTMMQVAEGKQVAQDTEQRPEHEVTRDR